MAALFPETSSGELSFEQEDAMIQMLGSVLVGGGADSSKLPDENVLMNLIIGSDIAVRLVELIKDSIPQSQEVQPDDKKKRALNKAS